MASIARQAAAAGLTAKCDLLITPGSEQVRATIERDGLLADLEAIGATVLANACGPCIGQWSRPASITGAPNTIVNSFNRNFPKRNDGSANTLSFVTSPDTVLAIALSGRLDFDPTTDTITAPDGSEVTLDAPVGEVLPDRATTPVSTPTPLPRPIAATSRWPCHRRSDRLQLLAPVPRVGRQRLPRPPGADEGAGQVHDRPHLGGRPVAQVPRPPREHLRQPLRRRRQRIHRRSGHGQGHHRRRDPPLPGDRHAVPRGRHPLGGDRRPQLRRRIVARARRDGAPLPRRPRHPRPVVRPDPRDQRQEAGPAAADVRRPRHLRPDRRGRPHQRPRPAARPRPERASARSSSPTAPPSTSRRSTPSAPNRSSGSKAGSALNIVRQKVAAAG